jgi:hypothetical protein
MKCAAKGHTNIDTLHQIVVANEVPIFSLTKICNLMYILLGLMLGGYKQIQKNDSLKAEASFIKLNIDN